MYWIDRMQIAYEARTDRMIDEMYGARFIECSQCNEYFNSEDAFESEHAKRLDFCSENCLDTWEEDFLLETEEGEVLDNQLPIRPVICTYSHTKTQKEGVLI